MIFNYMPNLIVVNVPTCLSHGKEIKSISRAVEKKNFSNKQQHSHFGIERGKQQT